MNGLPMTGVDIDAVHRRNDRLLAQMERASLQPSQSQRAIKYRYAVDFFASLSLREQAQMIREYMQKFPVQLGLFGEAVNEHALAKDIAAAFYAHDTNLLGQLVDRAMREYIGGVVVNDKDYP